MSPLCKNQLISLIIAWVMVFILPLLAAIITHVWFVLILPAITLPGLVLATIHFVEYFYPKK